MVGNPTLIDTHNILLRSTAIFVLSTEIEKAFLQVKLAECDRDLLYFSGYLTKVIRRAKLWLIIAS